MSVSVWDTEQVLHVNDIADADVVLLSREHQHPAMYYAHKFVIFSACPRITRYLKNWYDTPKGLRHVETGLSARVLYLVVMLSYPPHMRILGDNYPPLTSHEDYLALITVACELKMTAALKEARRALIFLSSAEPQWVYLAAYIGRLPDVCRAAAFEALRLRNRELSQSNPLTNELLRSVTGEAVQAFYDYHERCKDAIICDVFPKDTGRYDCAIPDPRMVGCLCEDRALQLFIRPYWDWYADAVYHLLNEKPHMTTVYAPELLASARERASHCPSCATHATAVFDLNVERLREDVERVIRQVPIPLPIKERDYNARPKKLPAVSGWTPALFPMKEKNVW
ncbi:hypothetical protein K488DRAFT_84497 [Vararia minispora EC-137]|uniref:Uncharacterized protein n=1 Tax=Vararia minispora EC-137 TaxID=1314806 RepID=A0ACB8QQK7_9AGAM|nr:hypothetical protein K488DRAFT_84497 [Vararia minispora EC-137]